MIRCVMDTSHKFLTVGLFKDDQLLFYIYKESLKSQSEHMIEAIHQVFTQCQLQPKDLDACVVAVGPGSYTGVRIAMTVAKTLFATAKIPIYTTTSLQLIAGSTERAFVMLDARSKRAYGAFVSLGKLVGQPAIYSIDQIKEVASTFDGVLLGDLHLLGLEDDYGDIEDGLTTVNAMAQLCEYPDALTPLYLKSLEDYQV